MIKNIRQLLTLASLFYAGILLGQNSNDARPVTSTYYIKNAFVVQKPGMVLPATSIVVKDGLITEMGKNISAPWDAKVIDADSMYVYASFIDAATHAGIPKGDKEDRPDVDDPGNPPNDVAGVTPQLRAVDLIDYKDKSIKEMREAGFGYLHVLPRGRMLPGSGAIITTGEGGRDQMVMDDRTAMFSQLKSARGVFPNTVIGVMSKYRDVYKNAEFVKSYKSTYANKPAGLTRPNKSKELEAMSAVVDRKMPVFFKAEKARDIYKVLTLQSELGFDLVLTDVRQANMLASKIKSKNIPVILSLKLPKKIEDKKDDKKDDDKKTDKDGGDKKDDVKESEKGEDEAEKKKDKAKEEKKEEDSPAKIAFDKRKMDSYIKYESQAADLAKVGMKISFSTLSAKPKEVKDNVSRMIERGLTSDQALAALTTNAAAITGLSAVAGTVETGKLGNIFISDKPYFEEKSKIKYSIVDGILYEYKDKPKKKKGEATGELGDISGTWTYALEIPGQETTGKMVVTKDGDSYKIKLDSADEPGDWEEAFDVEASGNNVTFGLTVDNEGFTLNITSDMTFEEDSFEGTMSIAEFGSFPVTGSKLDPK